MSKRMRRHSEWKSSFLGRPSNHPLITGNIPGRFALVEKQVGQALRDTSQLAQSSKLPCADWMHGWQTALRASHVDSPNGKINIVPAQRNKFAGSQA